MSYKNRKLILIKRIFIWILYFYSGFILYSKKGFLFSFLIGNAKVIYPLSIFWLQLRLKRGGKWFIIDSSMSTSQLWFNILPVLASFFTVVISITNMLLYSINKLT